MPQRPLMSNVVPAGSRICGRQLGSAPKVAKLHKCGTSTLRTRGNLGEAMANILDRMPTNLRAELMGLLHEVDGELEIVDMKSFVLFVSEHGAEYPELLEFLNI